MATKFIDQLSSDDWDWIDNMDCPYRVRWKFDNGKANWEWYNADFKVHRYYGYVNSWSIQWCIHGIWINRK